MRPRASWVRLACVALLGCGGQVGGGDAGSASADGSADAGSTADAPLLDGDAASDGEAGAPQMCASTIISPGLGMAECSIQTSTQCIGPDTTYTTDCSCPAGTCACTTMTGTGPAKTITVAYPGCPGCSYNTAEICGFPYF